MTFLRQLNASSSNSDTHEWINKIATVPIYYLAKPQRMGLAESVGKEDPVELDSSLTS